MPRAFAATLPGRLRRRAKAAAFRAYQPVALRLIAGDRTSRVQGLRLSVPAGVFHPGLFCSTRALCAELTRLPLGGRRVLDLGCGSGAVGLVAARRGAHVTAVDLNPAAAAAARANAAANDLTVEVLESDLFDALGGRRFDLVAVNPPYYRGEPADAAGAAWHAGAGLEWFDRFFAGLTSHVAAPPATHLGSAGLAPPPGLPAGLMVLSEDCDLAAIEGHAAAHGWRLTLRARRLAWFEASLVFDLVQR
ncbi:MAG: methyltransferase [Acidimicrobiales bacterium]